MLIEARRPARQALRDELERAGFEILADVATIHGAESALRSMAPAVVVLDPDLPGVSAVDACRRIVAAAQNDAAVIVHARRGDAASVRAALDSGIHSYLVKTVASEGVLVAAIRRVAAGEAVLDPRAALALQRASLDEQPLRPPLSEREREVLALVAEGLTNAAIGRRLYLSRHTVKEYLSAAMRKLGVSSRVEAAVAAAQGGLIPRSEDAARPSGDPGDNDLSTPAVEIRPD